MTSLTGVVSTWPGRRWWGPFSDPAVELAPDHALFVFRRADHALRRVELSAGDARRARRRSDEEGVMLRRDFGVRLTVACTFAGELPGEVEAEVRLRVLAGAAEWPRELPSETPALAACEAAPETVLAQLIGGLFAADLARALSDQPYGGLSLRLHDPALVSAAEAAVRAALARPAEEGVLALRGIDLLRIESPQEDERRREEQGAAAMVRRAETRENFQDRIHALEQRRLAREQARANVRRRSDEVRWRLFEPSDLCTVGACPPRLCRESSERQAALTGGHHLQILVRPCEPSHAYVLALGPYRTGPAGAVEYRWLRLFGNGGATELRQRPPRAGGNRLSGNDLLVFPGDAGASELFQHYLTLDSAPGTELLVVALSPQPVSDAALAAALPVPTAAPEAAFQVGVEGGLRATFGVESRLYLFRFSHA